jgi:hypothetical protein
VNPQVALALPNSKLPKAVAELAHIEKRLGITTPASPKSEPSAAHDSNGGEQRPIIRGGRLIAWYEPDDDDGSTTYKQ